MSLYGVEEIGPSRDWNLPLSFKQYLRCLLKRSFWGDKIVLYAVSCMWRLKVTILNTKTLSKSIEYNMTGQWIMPMQFSYFSNTHFNTAGK